MPRILKRSEAKSDKATDLKAKPSRHFGFLIPTRYLSVSSSERERERVRERLCVRERERGRERGRERER